MNSIKQVDAATRAAANPFRADKNKSILSENGVSLDSGTLLPDHCSGVFVHRIERAGLLAVAFAAILVLATGCSSTGPGLSVRLISHQKATNPKDDSWYHTPRSPGFDPDLFGS